MRIAHVIRQFFDYSGAEIYVYELAREQLRLGHEVCVAAPIQGGDLRLRMMKVGVIVMQPTQALAEFKPDLLHIHNAHVVKEEATEKVPSVATLHDAEDSIDRGEIRKWVVVRPELARLVPALAVHIPNGFDLERFRPMSLPASDRPKVLCIGNFRDKRRLAMLEDLLVQSEKGEIGLTLVGLGIATRVLRRGATICSMRWDVENLIALCTHTAGVYVGRTTIEGWLCGRPGWIYDEKGNKELLNPSLGVNEKYNIKTVTGQVMRIYQEFL